MVNLVATRKNFDDTGRAVSKWARAKNFVPGTVSSLLNGSFPMTGKVGQSILEAMKEDGLLVVDEVVKEAA